MTYDPFVEFLMTIRLLGYSLVANIVILSTLSARSGLETYCVVHIIVNTQD